MTLHLFDHIAFFLLALAFPVWDFFATRKAARLIRAGRTELRMKLYRLTIVQEWAIAIVLLIAWFSLGRSAATIGWIPRGGGLAWAGYGLAALTCALLLYQSRSIVRSPKSLASMRETFRQVSWLLPHTLKERRTFEAVSITAGICEEVIFRGYLIAYLMAAFGAPFWVAAILSSVVFAYAHAYQGPTGVPRVAAVGGLLALLYGLTGSLWASIFVHAVMDIVSGRIAHATANLSGPDRSPSELAA